MVCTKCKLEVLKTESQASSREDDPFQLIEYQMGGGWLYLILQGNWYLPTRAEDNTPLEGLSLSTAGGGLKPLVPHTHHREGFLALVAVGKRHKLTPIAPCDLGL